MTMQPIVLGLGGLYGAGKDALADYLVEHYGFVKLGMSDTLAHALYTLNPWIPINTEDRQPGQEFGMFMRYQPLVDAQGYVEAKKNPEVRRLLQSLGTEVGRKILGDRVWVDIQRDKINYLTEQGKHVVVTGVRYENEADLFEELGATTAWVTRGDDGSNKNPTALHSSETTLTAEDFDEIVYNTGTLEHLYSLADALISREEQWQQELATIHAYGRPKLVE